jgi:hypothetical protein
LKTHDSFVQSNFLFDHNMIFQDEQGLIVLDPESLKEIYIIHEPYDLTDQRKKDTIFETNSEIKYIGFNSNKSINEIIIVEDIMFVQIYKLTKTIQKSQRIDFSLTLVIEYFVSDTFTGDKKFKIVSEMLYEGFTCTKIEKKGKLNKDTLKIYADYHGLKDDRMSEDYPLVSNNKYLLYIGENKTSNNEFEAVLMPAFNEPVSPQIPLTYYRELKFEFYYFHDERFIVYIMHGEKLPGRMLILIFKINGEMVASKEILFYNRTGPSEFVNFPILISQNGKYIAYPCNPYYEQMNDRTGTGKESREMMQ